MDHQLSIELAVRPKSRSLVNWMKKGVARVRRWQQLAGERQLLASLSDAALKDLGLNRGEVYSETQRPFWDDPLGK